jgi:thioredoxin reductase
MYDLIIIGGGPAGITAAAIAINQRLETLIIAECWGGQTTYAMRLEDTEGREIITGETLLDTFRQQLDYLDFVHRFDTVTKLMHKESAFVVNTAQGNCFESKALILATGARPQRLDVPGEARFTGCGLSYSATTHASLFLGKDAAVVGNGLRAQWAATDLARKAHHVYLLAPEPLTDTPLVRKIQDADNINILEGVTITEIHGDQYVEGVTVAMPEEGAKDIPVKGVFVKLLRTPNSALVQGWVDCDSQGRIIVDVNCATNWPGIFAAGDVTHVSEQVLVHIGEGAKAALSAYSYLLVR